MKDAEVRVQLIFTDAALAAVLEEIETRKARLQASHAEAHETLEARSDALTRQLERP